MKKRSVSLGIATVLATAYAIYLCCHFYGGTLSADSAGEAIGSAIATAMVTPHMVMFFLGAIFGWVSFLTKKAWGALVAAILYSVGTVLFLLYAMFGLPILILGFVGYANQKKVNKKQAEQVAEQIAE